MNTYHYGFVLCVALLLSACGGGGGGGSAPSSGNPTLSIALASDTPPPRVIAGMAYQEVFAFTMSNGATGTTAGVKSVSVAVTGDPTLVAALSLQLTESGTLVGSVEQVSGGRASFPNLSVNVAAGSAKRFAVLVAVTGDVSWNTGERTKKMSFSISQSDVVTEGTSTVSGSATSSPMYRERGRIVFPLGMQVDYFGTGELHWTGGNNIWIGDMETLTASALTNDIGDIGQGGSGLFLPRIRFGMTPSPSFDRIAFGELNDGVYNEVSGMPYSIKTDGTDLVRHTPEICPADPSREMTYSPDGNFIVYRTLCSQGPSGTGGYIYRSDIVAARTDGSTGFRITSDEREDYSPVVSADGTAVYFLSCNFSSPNECKVYVVGVNLAGGYATEAPRVLVGNDWNWTALVHYYAPPSEDYYISPSGYFAKRWLSLSPDGKKLLITFKRNNGPSTMGIYDIAGNTMTEVGEGSSAYWAQDGRIVFFKPPWREEDEREISWKQSDDPIPAYFMEGDGSNVRDASGICLGANWQSCAFGLPLLPAL